MSEEKKLELVYEILNNAKFLIGQVYKPEGETCCKYDDYTDDKVREYYYELNGMCLELSERGVFPWQKEDKNED